MQIFVIYITSSLLIVKIAYGSIQATKHVLWPDVCKNYWQRTSFQKNIGFTSKISICKLMKIGKEGQKIGEICCFLGTNFLLYLWLTANIYPVYLMQP